MRVFLFAFSMAFIAGTALADTTAVYAGPGGFKMTIEVAQDGDIRGNVSAKPGEYFLTHSGEGYVVQTTAAGLVVDRLADVADAMAKVAAERIPSPTSQLAVALSQLHSTEPLLVEGGDREVNGRVGTAYFWRGTPSSSKAIPAVIISHDAALGDVGRAAATQMAMSGQLASATLGFELPQQDQVVKLLRQGAPLQISGASLMSVDHAPLPQGDFKLPAAPERQSDLLKRIRANSTDQVVRAF